MEFKVTVSVELGPNTFALLSGIMQRTATSQGTEAAPTAQADKIEKTTAKSGGAGKPSKEDAPAFTDLTDDEKIEAIKTEVTKHTKRGKSGDIKALLTFVGVSRVSELQGEDIDTFMSLVQRYGKGEDINTLTEL